MKSRPYRPLTPALVFLCVACATPSAVLPPVSPEAVAAEEAIQRRLVLEELDATQRLLDDVGFRLLAAATPLCEEAELRIGARFGTAGDYQDDYVEALSSRLSLTDTLTILAVAAESPASRAGLAPGDRILSIDGRSAPTGEPGTAAFADAIAYGGDDPLELVVEREGSALTVLAMPLPVCDYDLVVTSEGGINAYADGERVVLPWAMMRFATADELTVIVGHEIAHNAMGHSDAAIQNMVLGGLLGLALDLADDEEGDESDDSSAAANLFALGAEAFSQDFEREADYVGAYIVARAGHSLDSLPHIWRRFASVNPEAISYAQSHPTTAERFVRLARIIEEIQSKISRGEDLLPDLEGR